MERPLTAHRDKCGLITDVVFKQAKHPNDIQETYFKCEHCHYRYTSFVTDAWVRKQHRKAKGNLVINEEVNERMTQLKYNLINYGRADL